MINYDLTMSQHRNPSNNNDYQAENFPEAKNIQKTSWKFHARAVDENNESDHNSGNQFLSCLGWFFTIFYKILMTENY